MLIPMGSEKKKKKKLYDDIDHDREPSSTYSSTPPKLSLPMISRPSMPPEMPTPPPKNTVSIPFQWEEAPGKPRPCHTQSEPKKSSDDARTLELPPRLLVFSETKVSNNNNMASPTTVLDGPYVGRAKSFTTSYRSPRVAAANKDYWNGNFGSRRWSSFRKNNNEEGKGSFDFSSCALDGTCRDHGTTKVKITRVRRRGSFLSLSQARSHFWASIYESFKQVVPWRRRQEKQRKMGSQN